MDKIVTVATFFNTEEAYILKGLLESRGIPSWIFDEHIAAAYTPLVVGGVKLVVKQSNLERANKILNSVVRSQEPE